MLGLRRECVLYSSHSLFVAEEERDHERLEVKWGGSDQDDVSKESERALYPRSTGYPIF